MYRRVGLVKQKGQNIMKSLKDTRTDFEKLAAVTDDEIDCSDIPEMSKESLETAKWLIETPEKEQVAIG